MWMRDAGKKVRISLDQFHLALPDDSPSPFTYDPVGRLRTVTKDGTLVEEYRYNAVGTRVYEMNALRGIGGRGDNGHDHKIITCCSTSDLL